MRHPSQHLRVVLALAALAGCRASSTAPEAGSSDAAATVSASATPSPSGPAAASADAGPDADAGADADADAGSGADADVDAGSGSGSGSGADADAGSGSGSDAGSGAGCKRLRGPTRLSLKGPALLWSADAASRTDFRVTFNRDGTAQHIAPTFPAAPAAAAQPPGASLLDAGAGDPIEAARASWPACAAADRSMFCMDLNGSIRRTTPSGEGESPVAFGRRGSGIAAVALPGGHTLLAFLADRKTTEGAVTQAFAVLDDKPAVQLSEEGSGATFVTLAPWRGKALALYIDARSALTPVHARLIGLTGDGKLDLGQDAVIFVGEATDGRMSGALGVGAEGPAFALVPAAKDLSEFGMAALRIDDAPKDDMPAVWSLYPNGLSPAPLAATLGASPIRVARARPASRAAGSPHVLELGVLGESGRFQARCEAAEGTSFKHVALDIERGGALWLAYTNAAGTWLEQWSLEP